MTKHGLSNAQNGWVAGFVLPMRDAVRECRWANGRGKPPVS